MKLTTLLGLAAAAMATDMPACAHDAIAAQDPDSYCVKVCDVNFMAAYEKCIGQLDCVEDSREQTCKGDFSCSWLCGYTAPGCVNPVGWSSTVCAASATDGALAIQPIASASVAARAVAAYTSLANTLIERQAFAFPSYASAAATPPPSASAAAWPSPSNGTTTFSAQMPLATYPILNATYAAALNATGSRSFANRTSTLWLTTTPSARNATSSTSRRSVELTTSTKFITATPSEAARATHSTAFNQAGAVVLRGPGLGAVVLALAALV